LLSVWGNTPNDVYAVGAGGEIIHYDGASWAEMISGTQNDLWDVSGDDSGRVFAVGRGGTIQLFDGSTWRATLSGTGLSLLAVWATTDEAFSGGGNGIIVRTIDR
jgi:hypothetical protein